MSDTEISVDTFLAKVYDLFLTTPFESAFRQDEDGPEGEPPPTDPDVLMAVQADRFALMSAVRRLRNEAQRELPLEPGMTDLSALKELAKKATPAEKTGWPPGMLQDDDRGLSRWLANRIDSRRHAREAAAAIRRLSGQQEGTPK